MKLQSLENIPVGIKKGIPANEISQRNDKRIGEQLDSANTRKWSLEFSKTLGIKFKWR